MTRTDRSRPSAGKEGWNTGVGGMVGTPSSVLDGVRQHQHRHHRPGQPRSRACSRHNPTKAEGYTFVVVVVGGRGHSTFIYFDQTDWF